MLEKIPVGRSEVDLESTARPTLLLDPLLAGRLLLLFDAFHLKKKKERKKKRWPGPLIELSWRHGGNQNALAVAAH